MPLAVKRMQLKDLPAKVHLDDSMAMMPQMKLSQYDEVLIGARISFSGQPVAKKGDWQGESKSILWKEADQIEIIINQQVE
jgi:cytochrome c-type biogenesis protein CcmH